MKYYKIYTITAVFILVVFLGFVGMVCFWPEPKIAGAISVPQKTDTRQELNDDSHSSAADFAGFLSEEINSQNDSKQLLSVDNSMNETSVIEINPDDSEGSFTPRASFIQPEPVANSSAIPSSSSTLGVSSLSGTSNFSSSNSSQPGSSGPGSSASSGPGGSAASGPGNSTSSGSGGGGGTEQPKKLFMFVGYRSEGDFGILNNYRLRPLFAPDFIWQMAGFTSEAEWARMMQLLRQRNQNIIIGYYHSSCTTLPSQKDFTHASKMPNEQASYDWLLRYTNGRPVTYRSDTPDRFMLDMRKQEVRQAMIALAISRAKHYGYDAVSFDNCYWGYSMPTDAGADAVVSAEEWTQAFMNFYEEAGKATHENGLKCIVNVATRASDIPLAFEAIAPYVDGIMTEMPFHESSVQAGRIERELAAYEKVAKEGTMVLLNQTIERRGHLTLDLARPLVDKYDNIYVAIEEFWPAYFRPGVDRWEGKKVPSDVPPVSTWYRNP